MIKTLVVADSLYIITDDLIFGFTEVPRNIPKSFRMSVYEKEDMTLLEENILGEWESRWVGNMIAKKERRKCSDCF